MTQQQTNTYMVQQIELSSQSSGSQLEEDVFDLQEIENSITDLNELDRLMKSTMRRGEEGETGEYAFGFGEEKRNEKDQRERKIEPKHVTRLQVIDDFIRNFLIKNNMTKTLSSFQKEWYQYVQNSKHQGSEIPDAYLQTEILKSKHSHLEQQLNSALLMSNKAKATYDKLLKQRDFHKMHHERVQKQKKKLVGNIQKLGALRKEYGGKYGELVEKYNFAMKDKMLVKIQRDRLKGELGGGKKDKDTLPAIKTSEQTQSQTQSNKFTPFPVDPPSPSLSKPPQPFNYKSAILAKTQKGHSMPVCSIAIHPKKPIIGTGSDDMLWKIWTVNQSQLIMSGQGHKDWISSLKFHPKGLHILTASGDSTFKIWDFVHTNCTYTFKDHRQPIWSLDINDSGDYVVTGSMDHSTRLVDINVGKCRSVVRGHVDSVNSVNWKQGSSIFGSASADKTVSVWDARSGLCTQTFYGHDSSVTCMKFNIRGMKLSSCDSAGMVKTWDLRMAKQVGNYVCPMSANCLSIDQSGTYLAVGCDGGAIYLFNQETGQKQHVLKGHEQKSRVQAVEFDLNSKMIVSGGSDCSYRVWQ